MNDNYGPVKAWEVGILIVAAGLLIGLVVLSSMFLEVK